MACGVPAQGGEAESSRDSYDLGATNPQSPSPTKIPKLWVLQRPEYLPALFLGVAISLNSSTGTHTKPYTKDEDP